MSTPHRHASPISNLRMQIIIIIIIISFVTVYLFGLAWPNLARCDPTLQIKDVLM
jgi:hypothetical protein